MSNGAIAPGDCLIITRPQPYVDSLADYIQGGGAATDFFAAFPESEKANLKLLSSTPAGSEIVWDNKEKVKITFKAAANKLNANGEFEDSALSFRVASMKNPFSAIQKTALDVRH